MKRRKLLAFVHIEKSAGTSMIHILRYNYFPNYIDVRPLKSKDRVFKSEDLNLYYRINPFLKAIGGHSVVPWGGLDQHVNATYTMVLRSPVERYVSQFRYWQSYLGKQISMEEYLNRDKPKNFQTRKIAGCEDVEKAIRVIESENVIAGVVEKFDYYLHDLEQRLGNCGFKALNMEKNVNRANSTTAQEIIEKYEDRLIENNRLDIELYDYVYDKVVSKRGETGHLASATEQNKRAFRLPVDYILRKAYVEPITGLLRMSNGLGYKGSY